MSVRTLSLSDVMAKINKNMDSKEDLLLLMDSLRRRAGGTFAILRPKSCKRNRLAMVKQGYIPLIVDIMHKYVNEELLVGSSCKVLFYLGSLPDSPVEDMLQLGARALVDEIMETNRDDKGNVRPEISQFNTMLNKLGGTSAVRDIRRQILALEFVKTQTEIGTSGSRNKNLLMSHTMLPSRRALRQALLTGYTLWITPSALVLLWST